MGKKEYKYRIEALEHEVSDREDLVALQRIRIRELIDNLDRLSLRYEPFIPEGDDDHGLDFYELVEDNKRLVAENQELNRDRDGVVLKDVRGKPHAQRCQALSCPCYKDGFKEGYEILAENLLNFATNLGFYKDV